MRSASYSSAVAVASLLSLGAACDASAGMIKCASKTITRPDFERMHATARRAAYPHVLQEKSLQVCMNPGSGLAWYVLQPEPQPDESTITFSMNCQRSTDRWSCELWSGRRATLQIELGGQQKAVEFEIPDGMPVAEGRKFVALAIETAPTLQVSQQSGSRPTDVDSDWEKRNLEALKKAYSLSAPSTWGGVERVEGGAVEVTIDDYVIRFKQTTDSGDWIFDCWLMDIIVT